MAGDRVKLKKVITEHELLTDEVLLYIVFLGPQQWNNPYLRWAPENYGNLKQILVDPREVWVPDVVLENK